MSYSRSSNTVINDTAGGDSVKTALVTRLSAGLDDIYAVANLIDADVVTAQAAADAKPSLGETSTTAYRGDRGKAAYDHSQSAHAPSNAQKNSDILKAEVEAVLTGEIDTHSHAHDAASETASGVVELATTTEASTGTDTERATTPAGVAAAITAQAVTLSQIYSAIGSVCFAGLSAPATTTVLSPGETIAGSSLYPAGVRPEGSNVTVVLDSTPLTGQWEACGLLRNGSGSTGNVATVFKRVE